MEKIIVGSLVLVSASMIALTSGRALAKGPEYLVIGGSDLAPYYYPIPEPGPVQGWLGLLPSQQGAGPGNDHPGGMIDAPVNSAELLARAYDVWFEDVPDQRTANARYVPAVSGSEPAYLFWQTPSGGMPYVAWFVLGGDAVGYLDTAIAAAKLKIAAGGVGLEKDWIAAEFHSPYYTGNDGPGPIVSGTYWISHQRDFSVDMKPLGVVTGDDASRLLESYALTLHNWHEVPPRGVEGYKVFTPAGREIFTFVPASGEMPARVMPAEAGGVYDSAPVLTSIITRALDNANHATPTANTVPSPRSSRTALVIAIAVAAGFLLALGSATIVARRRSGGIRSA